MVRAEASIGTAWCVLNPLSRKQILSVRCPVCRAKPKEQCTLTTGHPSGKTHHDRSLAAAKAGPPETFGLASLRLLKAASRGLRSLFHLT